MFDNFYTKYEDAKFYISEINAQIVISDLTSEVEKKNISAEKYAYLSKAYVFSGQLNLALKYAKLSIKLDKNYCFGQLRTAFAYAKLGKKKECLKHTLIADKTENKPSNILTLLIILYDYLGLELRKNELLDELLQNFNHTAEYAYDIGFYYSRTNPEKAVKYLKEAEQLGYKDKFNLFYNLATNFDETFDYENAELYVDRALIFGQTISALKLKAECLRKRGEHDACAKHLNLAYKLCLNPEDKSDILLLNIYNYLYSDKLSKCKKYIDFTEKNFVNDGIYYLQALYAEQTQNFKDAIFYYELMLKNKLDNESSIYSSISYCYSQLKKDEENIDKALYYAQLAVRNEECDPYCYYRLGRVYTDKKLFDDAIENFSKYLNYEPRDIDSFQWVSYVYSLKKDYEKSIEYANKAIMVSKTDSYSYFRKAWAYQELKKYDEAIKFYKKCIEYDDHYIDAYVNISFIYSKTGDTKNSMLYANKAILLNKDYAYAHYRKAWALHESGKTQEAIDGYSKAIELDPKDIYNYLGLACISLNNQENKEALSYANQAIFINRQCGGAYYYKSLALSNLGKAKEAEKAFATALELGYQP